MTTKTVYDLIEQLEGLFSQEAIAAIHQDIFDDGHNYDNSYDENFAEWVPCIYSEYESIEAFGSKYKGFDISSEESLEMLKESFSVIYLSSGGVVLRSL